jgi:phospholipase C
MDRLARLFARLAIFAPTLAILGGCGGGGPSSFVAPPPAASPPPVVHVQTPLEHIVVIVQENRSFDNFFAGYPGTDSRTFGFAHDGKRVPLRAIGFAPAVGLDHLWNAGITDWAHGKMNGFDKPGEGRRIPPTYMYSYLRHDQIKPYWEMAQQYVIADHMFPTEFGPSFTAHQNLIAGSTEVKPGRSVINLPTLDGKQQRGDCDAAKGTTTDLINTMRQVLRHAGPPPCFTYPSMADTLDDGQVSWKYYSGFWPQGNSTWDAFGAIKKVRYGPDWDRNVTKKPFQILTDVPKGKLPAVSWVIPTPEDSDHPGAGSDRGPSWVATVVDAIGRSSQWKSTAIIIVWDDWGGWYDNVSPPQLDYRGLGIRVPCLIVSAYAKAGYVDHTPYEFGSILKTIEENFGIASIGTTDVRATDMFDAFDFTQKPRAFKPFKAKYPPSDFRFEAPSQLSIPDPGDE